LCGKKQFLATQPKMSDDYGQSSDDYGSQARQDPSQGQQYTAVATNVLPIFFLIIATFIGLIIVYRLSKPKENRKEFQEIEMEELNVQRLT